ncbi:hypothetical protein MMC16_006202 [Acarospora aff. strigata]|nr:hypothetical protein [Acarospora aff. strigata]
MSITRSMVKKTGAQSIDAASKPHITFYRKDMSSLKSARVYKNGRPFIRKYHKFTKLYFTAPKNFRSQGVVTEKGENYYVKRDQLKLGFDDNIKYIDREVRVVKDNPIIRLKLVDLDPASVNVGKVKVEVCHDAERKLQVDKESDVVFISERPISQRWRI